MSFDNSRTENLIGTDGTAALSRAHAAVFGCGGVGGYVIEALCRAGIGEITVVDGDAVAPSNLNRQIIAVQSTVGTDKTEAAEKRIREINPDCKVHGIKLFYLPENAASVDFSQFDIVADCVDTVSAKLEIITRADAAGVPVISAMGAGNKLYPERFRITDIYKTETDPLARVMRRELRSRGVRSLPVCWSDEPPVRAAAASPDPESGKIPPASISFVPSAAGLIIAGWMVRRLIGLEN